MTSEDMPGAGGASIPGPSSARSGAAGDGIELKEAGLVCLERNHETGGVS